MWYAPTLYSLRLIFTSDHRPQRTMRLYMSWAGGCQYSVHPIIRERELFELFSPPAPEVYHADDRERPLWTAWDYPRVSTNI